MTVCAACSSVMRDDTLSWSSATMDVDTAGLDEDRL